MKQYFDQAIKELRGMTLAQVFPIDLNNHMQLSVTLALCADNSTLYCLQPPSSVGLQNLKHLVLKDSDFQSYRRLGFSNAQVDHLICSRGTLDVDP